MGDSTSILSLFREEIESYGQEESINIQARDAWWTNRMTEIVFIPREELNYKKSNLKLLRFSVNANNIIAIRCGLLVSSVYLVSNVLQ